MIAVATEIHDGAFSDREIGVHLLCELHHALFADVRWHAGQTRAPGVGTEYLEFGPNRSDNRRDVPAKLNDVFEQARKYVLSCESHPDDPAYERGAFHIAVWVHARVIQIHPFEDGNGRTSRLLMNVVLVRLGLPPMLAEFPKQEYNLVLNAFFRTGEIQPVLDLLLPCCLA